MPTIRRELHLDVEGTTCAYYTGAKSPGSRWPSLTVNLDRSLYEPNSPPAVLRVTLDWDPPLPELFREPIRPGD